MPLGASLPSFTALQQPGYNESFLKTSAHQIAERYARALFDVAGKSRDQIEADLLSLAAAMKDSATAKALANPLLSKQQLEKALAAALDKLRASDATRKFIALLSEKKRIAVLPEISAIFSTLAAAARGELHAELISAAPLSAKEVENVRARLAKAYGKDIVLETRQDASLLGGVIIKIGSVQLDASLAGKLMKLETRLKAA